LDKSLDGTTVPPHAALTSDIYILWVPTHLHFLRKSAKFPFWQVSFNSGQARNQELPETRRMQVRIGINLGDVIEEEDRIYGDGVNIAARLESLAEPGGI
jgi:Adenylate and Guanylate cyclase catalytic domain